MAGTWIALPPAPFNVGTMLLLTDGVVFAQENGTSNWWRLFPGQTGSYVSGQWRKAQSSRHAPLSFASAVLRDGRVLIAGGKLSGGVRADLCAAELYDPETDVWVDLPTPDGWTAIGDAPCCVLPNGTLLLGSINDNRCALFDTAARRWSPAARKHNASSKGETWTLLPDGSVLTADCDGAQAAERYLNDTWIAAGQTPDSLVETASLEIGPAILLPDGRVLALGATGATALFDPAKGGWDTGPRFPHAGVFQLGAKDAPACLLPGGRVLCVAGPVDGTPNRYDGPSVFFEFDPAANKLIPVSDPQPSLTTPPRVSRMLLLPTGEVLVANASPRLLIYQSDMSPDDAWRPQITHAPDIVVAGGTYLLEGTQLTGLSQACSYGDDASMATNYPLVRLRSVGQPESVSFARTADHSSMAVATGPIPQFTRFTLSPELSPGGYRIVVVTNGLESAEIPLTVVASATSSLARTQSHVQSHVQHDVQPEITFQEELFWRELNEVYLLIDFVSGRADRSLLDLKGVPDPEGKVTELSPQQVVQRICEIRFPPQGTVESKALQASLLLTAKDRFSNLADPARSLTIAYTRMFSSVIAPSILTKLALWAGYCSRFLTSKLTRNLPTIGALSVSGHPASAGGENGATAHPDHSKPFSSFAEVVYPQLQSHANRFCGLYSLLPYFALVITILTALFYWDVALESSIIDKIAKGKADIANITALERKFRPSETSCPQAPSDADQAADCARWKALQDGQGSLRDNLLSLAANRRHPIGWIVGELDWNFEAGDHSPASEQLVIDLITVMRDYVIPMMFGLLGTLVGLSRAIAAKVLNSTLSPHDYVLTLASLPVGLVAGLAVGVILVPSQTAAQGAGALGVTLSITNASLAFLAGYGADAFFALVDKLLGAIFSFTAQKSSGSNGAKT